MLRLLSKKKVKTFIAFLSAAALIFPVPILRADETAEEIEEKTSDLKRLLSEINKDLLAISDEIDLSQMQIEITNSEIHRTQDALKTAKEDESRRYDAMKARIKYMYERGDSTMLELLFSAKSMTDLINKADFISSVTDYDRDMLGKLQEICDHIASESLILQQQRSSLSDIKKSLKEKQAALTAAAGEARADLNEYYVQLEEIRKKEAEEAARKAAEEARKREEEAARRRAEEDARRKRKEDENNGVYQSDSGWTIDCSHAPMEAANENELKLFAAILQCEAIAEYEAMLAVATVILNRVESPRFANTITDVIYAPGQFEPVWTGRLDMVLNQGPVSLAFTVAQDALDGARLAEVADCYYFLYAGSTSRAGVNVGDNLFFPVW